jgi:hypothetical protein
MEGCDAAIQGWCETCGLSVCAPLHGSQRDETDRFMCSRCYGREKGEAPQ